MELKAFAAQTNLRESNEFRLLAQAGDVLSSSLDYPTTLQSVADLAVPHLADWCAVDMLNDCGQLESVAVAHVDADKVRWVKSLQDRFRHNMDANHGMPNVIRTGISELYSDIVEELLIPRGATKDDIETVCKAGFRALVLVPLTVRGIQIGGMAIVSDTPGRYSQDDVEFFDLLAKRAAVAIDNARLYTMAQRELAARIEAEAELRANEAALEARVKERTAELKSAYDQLETFSYSVSHDLRSPLRGINSAVSILLADYGDAIDEVGRNELRRAAASTKRMARLIDDLLEFARLGMAPLSKRELDVSDLARTVVADFEQADPDRVVPNFVIQDGMKANADPLLLRVVLQNLLENAVKFSSVCELPKIEAGASDDGQTFFVRDNGVGFNPEYAHNLFEPFRRLHSSEFTGSGIGLANVKRVIERHGGTVWAKGEVGKGATFSFTL